MGGVTTAVVLVRHADVCAHNRGAMDAYRGWWRTPTVRCEYFGPLNNQPIGHLIPNQLDTVVANFLSESRPKNEGGFQAENHGHGMQAVNALS
jgi:hypothetical protein